MRFYLGTHQPQWLADPRCADLPLFVSRRTLSQRKTLPRAVTSWALDSGGFTELQMHGRWTVTPADYVAEVRRFRDQIGRLDWAAPQDWMCEAPVIHGLVERRSAKPCPECKAAGRQFLGTAPRLRVVDLDADERPTMVCACGYTTVAASPRIHVARWRAWAAQAGPVMAGSVAAADRLGMDAVVVFHGTGLGFAEHQRRTVCNFVELRELAPDLPFIPVLQGAGADTYVDHVRAYGRAGIDLRAEPLVGVGSVCRRQGTHDGTAIMELLEEQGLRLHGFGYKTLGLRAVAPLLKSADSLAWSDTARRAEPLPDHDKPGPGRPKGHINCANCLTYALEWRASLLSGLSGRRAAAQLSMFETFAERPAA